MTLEGLAVGKHPTCFSRFPLNREGENEEYKEPSP